MATKTGPGKHSAALLAYRIDDSRGLMVFIGHMGGPYWARKDEGGWSIPKGEFGPDEQSADAALREFAEEIGVPAPAGELRHLGEFVQRSGKTIHAYAVAADRWLAFNGSNEFEMEWPRGSGRRQSYPEIDRADWFPLATAREKVVPGQVAILEALAQQVGVGE